MLLAAACDFDKDLQDPNQVQLNSADINLVLNAVQLDFADFYYAAHGRVAPLVRQIAMTGGNRYQTAYNPQNQDDVWKRAYADVLINAQTVVKMGTDKNFPNHAAVAKIFTAFTYLTLVDLFGDVPQVDALKAEDKEFNPTPTSGAAVYAYALGLLTEARATLGAGEGADLVRDIYYDGDLDLWITLANTLELKAWVNISTSAGSEAADAKAKIDALFADADADIIDTEAENFTYKYSSITVPDSRHPLYNQFYGVDEGLAGGYLGTSFMYELYRGKPDPTAPGNPARFTQDPRWRYYFSRQAGSVEQINTIDPKAIGCTPGAPPAHYRAGGYPFCVFDPGFYGRDHGDNSGTPPDGPVITAAGVYPAGGRADNADDANANFKSQTQRGQGANGAGILPIYMSFYTDFLRAEHAARFGGASAATLLETAVSKSIYSVKKFADGLGESVTVEPWASDFDNMVDTYLDAVGVQYTAESDKVAAVGREFWVATWGNGVEAYNAYRRTGGPVDPQPALLVTPGPWMRSLIYSANYVNLNQNAQQKKSDVVNKVFWDGNPDTLN